MGWQDIVKVEILETIVIEENETYRSFAKKVAREYMVFHNEYIKDKFIDELKTEIKRLDDLEKETGIFYGSERD